MNTPDTTLEILTLGRFSISIDGKPVATDWPDETVKVFFCSLLSPLDLYFTWDRICRSMWDVPETRSSRYRLEEIFIRPLNSFLIKELGFNPLITGHEGIRIDHQRIHVDALEFHSSVVEGLRLMSLGNHEAAFDKFSRANSLYAGIYLPGMPGKIIENTRNDLDSLYRTVVMDGVWQASSTLCPNGTALSGADAHGSVRVNSTVKNKSISTQKVDLMIKTAAYAAVSAQFLPVQSKPSLT